MNRAARSWEAFGREDPLGTILTNPGAEHGGWNVDEFFATGRDDVDDALAQVPPHRDLSTIRRVLDFGCGVGRLTRALATRFDDVVGVDVAATMIARARDLVPPPNCAFVHNPHPDLRLFADREFDLVFSLLTLQHLRPRDALRYVAEFGRVLAPGGVALFQLPTGPRRGTLLGDKPVLRHLGTLASAVVRTVHIAWKHSLRQKPVMEMFGVPERCVEQTLRSAGCALLAIRPDHSAGPDWHSRLYVAGTATQHDAVGSRPGDR